MIAQYGMYQVKKLVLYESERVFYQPLDQNEWFRLKSLI
jgi:hypothetical protein